MWFTQRSGLESSSKFTLEHQSFASPDHSHLQVKNLPEHSAKSRQEFVLSRLMSAARHFMWFDFAQFYIRHNPAYKSAAAFASQNFTRRILACSGYLVFYYCMGVIIHSLMAALAVSCTSSEPSSWPNFFGKWEDAYTIRRFWG